MADYARLKLLMTITKTWEKFWHIPNINFIMLRMKTCDTTAFLLRLGFLYKF